MSRPALRHGSLNSLFQVALYLPRHLFTECLTSPSIHCTPDLAIYSPPIGLSISLSRKQACASPRPPRACLPRKFERLASHTRSLSFSISLSLSLALSLSLSIPLSLSLALSLCFSFSLFTLAGRRAHRRYPRRRASRR